LKTLKIAIINTYDSKDIKMWSGIPYHISVMLENLYSKDNISCIKAPQIRRDFISYLSGLYFNRIRKKKYLTWCDKRLLEKYKSQFSKLIEEEFDLIITFQFSLVPLLKNKHNKIIWWSDATFQNLLDNYSYVTNICSYCIKGGHDFQKQALNNSIVTILSSDWAIDTATGYYNTGRSKISKIPLASNLSIFPTIKEIETILRNKVKNCIKLLFIGLDWERKGGDDAVKVFNNLNQLGFKTQLLVVGSNIPKRHVNNPDLIPIGLIDKSTKNGESYLTSLIKESTFLILPSRAECFGVVFCEANSFALPVITTDVGGISSAVQNGKNGGSFPVDQFVEKATSFIINNLPSTDKYLKLCNDSFTHYNDNMSWKQVEQGFINAVENI
jgi:glycosyltransferase involved in cell wall biosynthesis